jgi:hypothetical protein
MQRSLAVVSALAGAIVGVVKLVGLAVGSEWLGSNWKATLGYAGALWFGLWGLLWVIMMVFGGAAVLAIYANTIWFVGLWFFTGGLVANGIWASQQYRQHKLARTCPYCLQTFNVNALVCHHCGRDLIEGSPENEGPDLTPLSVAARTEPHHWAARKIRWLGCVRRRCLIRPHMACEASCWYGTAQQDTMGPFTASQMTPRRGLRRSASRSRWAT